MKYFKYLKYVLRHKYFVMIFCFKEGLYLQGILHDLSKLRFSEFIPYARYFYGGSNEDNGDELFDRAWLYHIHRNPHHWQYWILIQDEDDNKILEMPIKYLKEMICDWRGAGKAQGRFQPNELQDWYEAHKSKMQINKTTLSELQQAIKLLEKAGEE